MDDKILIPAKGWFMNDIVVWNEFDYRGFAAKGFMVEVADYRIAANEEKNNFHTKINSLLRLTYQSSVELHTQIHWSVDSDYRKMLYEYDQDTEKLAKNKWTYNVRKERYNRYTEMMEKNQLRREKCFIYVSFKLSNKVPSNLSRKEMLKYYEGVIKNTKQVFSNYEEKLKNILGHNNVNINPMGDREHFNHMYEHANPGKTQRGISDPFENILKAEAERKKFDPDYCWQLETIENLVIRTGVKGNKKRNDDRDFGFYHDGCYEDILLLERWGSGSFPCQYYELTSLPFLDYSIISNIYPVNLETAKAKLVKDIDRLKTEMSQDSKSEAHIISIETKRERLKNYESGTTYPFECHYMIRIWDKDQTALRNKVNAVKTAIETMSGAGYYELSNERTQIQFFHISFPGWIFNKKKHYRLEAENHYLSDRIPISSTFHGHIEKPEAIFDGGMLNLVGIKNFINGTPQMAACFGMSGAGKSATMVDILSQTECYYDYTCIIEEGNSYGTFVKLMNEETLLVNPTSDFTINYFDTRQLPITNNHISSSAALVSKMCGTIQDEDKMRLRRAMLTYYIQESYNDKYKMWANENESKIPEIAKWGLASNRYWKSYMPKDSEFIEGWVEFRDMYKQKNEKALEVYSKVSEEDISKFIQTQKQELRNISHAWYSPEDYPVHSELCDILSTVPNLRQHSEEEVKRISTLLGQWRAGEGDSGKIFDGVTSIDLTGKVGHFELGMIPESADYMKPVVTFLINNLVRNHIITLPRSSRKRIIFEEVGRLLGVEGGEKIVSECFAQMRKFNTWVLTIIQQYEKFKHSPIRATITGNCKQYYLLAQRDRGDIKDMSKDIYMPQLLKETLTEYPQPEKAGYSCFSYWFDDTPKAKYGTIKNVVSKEMLYVASTKGEDVEKRERELKQQDMNIDLADTIKNIVKNDQLKNKKEVA
jgi:type IV secretion system protein TrbE